jgi:hypothetical protein
MTSEATSLPAGATPTVPLSRWRIIVHDLRYGAAALAVVAAGVVWLSWTGEFLSALFLAAAAFLYGIPLLLIFLAGSSLSAGPGARLLRRGAIQGFFVAVMSLPLVFVGAWVEGFSIRASQHRGDQIAAVLEAHGRAHGMYPKSLAALEEHSKVELPRPTISSVFVYEMGKDGRSYRLMFDDGHWNPWFRDSGSPHWTRLD